MPDLGLSPNHLHGRRITSLPDNRNRIRDLAHRTPRHLRRFLSPTPPTEQLIRLTSPLQLRIRFLSVNPTLVLVHKEVSLQVSPSHILVHRLVRATHLLGLSHLPAIPTAEQDSLVSHTHTVGHRILSGNRDQVTLAHHIRFISQEAEGLLSL